MKVYLVEVGCYSDASVIAAYTDEAVAAKLVAEIKEAFSGDAHVLPVELDARPVDVAGCKPFEVKIQRDGTAEVDGLPLSEQRRQAIFGAVAEDWGSLLNVTCWARDEQHAVKIANEIRTRMIAEGTWPK